MLPLRTAGTLLGATASLHDLCLLAARLGFDSHAAPLDDQARSVFGIDDSFADASLIRGPGSLRALVFSCAADRLRPELARAADKLTTRAPLGLWMLFGREAETHRIAIAAVSAMPQRARIAALLVDRARVLDSDAETLRQLVAAASPDDLGTHSRFVEILGRDAVTRRFFRQLSSCVSALAGSLDSGSTADRHEVALLYASRLLFLGFLESRGWLNDDAAFLTHAFDDCMTAGGGFHGRVLLPLFFGTLNTPVRRRAIQARRFGSVPFLNGGLFTRTPVERLLRNTRFSDEACGRFFGELLSRFRFTALEETSSFEETAIDPEMLGRAFESLMAASTRRTTGAYYTPHELVARVTELALAARLGDRPSLGGISKARILDPACGSGAFLVHVLDRLCAMRRDAGDARNVDVIRREVLANCIFGVDINPTAVWLCQLRLWLSIVVDTSESADRIAPLPNLDRNVRVGDSLSGPAFGTVDVRGGEALGALRVRYSRATGRRKATLARSLDRAERRLSIENARSELDTVSALRRDLVTARRGRDLFGGRYVASREEHERAEALRQSSQEIRKRIRVLRGGGPLPFSFPVHFAGVASDEGFTIVVGNPPWVRPHHVTAATRNGYRRNFAVARAAPWANGADASGAKRGFASQVDVAAVFVERSLQLLAPAGVLSLLLPSKLWRSLAAGGFRNLLMTDARLIRVEDYSDVPAGFDAAVYPGLLIASRETPSARPVGVTVIHRSRLGVNSSIHREHMALDSSPGAPWLLLPPDVRASFELLRAAGTPLSDSHFRRPLLGVKCGLNDAFLVRAIATAHGRTRIVAMNGREGILPASALRPVLRGEDVRPWRVTPGDERIIWTHDASGRALQKLPADLDRWLSPYRRALTARSDARHGGRWWSVFRTDGAACGSPRVVWADIGRGVRAAVIEADDPAVPLNTCYVVRCTSTLDALALCALLNSALVSAWLSVVAEQARGGYRRYLGWTMSLLPIPRDWDDCRSRLAALAEASMSGEIPDCALHTVTDTYGLRHRDVEPLLTWTAD